MNVKKMYEEIIQWTTKKKLIKLILKMLWRYFFSNEKIKIYEKKGYKSEYEWEEENSLITADKMEFARAGLNVFFILGFIYSLIMFPTLFFYSTKGKIISNNGNRIKYEYLIDGYKYTSDRIFMFGSIIVSKNIEKQKIKKYHVGDKVKVYYPIFNKNYSLLVVGIQLETFIIIIMCGVVQLYNPYKQYGVMYYRVIGWMLFMTVEYLITIIKLGRL